MFQEVVGLATQKVGRDGIAHERDEAPPGSILNSQVMPLLIAYQMLSGTTALCVQPCCDQLVRAVLTSSSCAMRVQVADFSI